MRVNFPQARARNVFVGGVGEGDEVEYATRAPNRFPRVLAAAAHAYRTPISTNACSRAGGGGGFKGRGMRRPFTLANTRQRRPLYIPRNVLTLWNVLDVNIYKSALYLR